MSGSLIIKPCYRYVKRDFPSSDKMLLQSNALFRNSENEEIFYQNFTCQGMSYVIILLDSTCINY